jgi:hypothetical protein
LYNGIDCTEAVKEKSWKLKIRVPGEGQEKRVFTYAGVWA